MPRHQVDVDLGPHIAIGPGSLQLRLVERVAAGKQHIHQRVVRPDVQQYAGHRIGVPRGCLDLSADDLAESEYGVEPTAHGLPGHGAGQLRQKVVHRREHQGILAAINVVERALGNAGALRNGADGHGLVADFLQHRPYRGQNLGLSPQLPWRFVLSLHCLGHFVLHIGSRCNCRPPSVAGMIVRCGNGGKLQPNRRSRPE